MKENLKLALAIVALIAVLGARVWVTMSNYPECSKHFSKLWCLQR
jgi:hypothetical protein